MRILIAALLFVTLPLLAQEQATQEIDSTSETGTQLITENPTLILHTTLGAITVELFEKEAPKSTANFLKYAREGHYNGTLFHRVINNFMIQGGGFDADFRQKPTHSPIENEADNGLENRRGTLAMARTNDPHSATSQFFINVVDNDFLNHRGKMSGQSWGYAVFGQVIDGMDIVDQIRTVATTNHGMHQDVPAEPVLIERVEIPE